MPLCGADRSVLDLEQMSCIQLVCCLLFYLVLIKTEVGRSLMAYFGEEVEFWSTEPSTN